MFRIVAVALFVFGLLIGSPAAYAHPFHAEPSGGFHDGWVHAWTGLDHLLAVAIVGVLASQLPLRWGWTLPAVFCISMAAGASTVGLTGAASTSGVILACVLAALGVCLWQPRSEVVLFTVATIAGFTHGVSHDFVSGAASGTPAIFGLVAMTALLHLAGYTAGVTLTHSRCQMPVLRIAAAATGIVAVFTAAGLI